jgi:hypothetical protein
MEYSMVYTMVYTMWYIPWYKPWNIPWNIRPFKRAFTLLTTRHSSHAEITFPKQGYKVQHVFRLTGFFYHVAYSWHAENI